MIIVYFAYATKKLTLDPFASSESAGRVEKSLGSINSYEKKPLHSPLSGVPSRRTGKTHISQLAIFMLLAFSSSSYAILDYDRAIIQSQKNNWPTAQELLTQVIVEHPDKPDALYDLGVAAYKNNNFDVALSYFNKTANHTDSNSQLQQQAHFNAGNTHVQLKQLHEAIDAYDRVLAQKPDHKEALHNKEVVKKMLEKQQQEDKQDKQEQNDESADDKSMADKQEQKNKDSENQDSQDNQDKQNKEDKEQNTNSPDNQKKDKQSSKNQDSADDKAMADRQEQNKKEKQSQSQDNNNSREQNKPDKQNPKQPDQSADAKAMADKKDKSGSQETNQPTAKPAASGHASGEGPDKKLSAGLARVLEDREKKDAQLNKKMTKALVANQGGSKNDYNCW